MKSMHRLMECSIGCLDSMPDVLCEAARRSDTGSVLVLHVRENGQQMSTFEVNDSDQKWLDDEMWPDDGRPLQERYGVPNRTEIAQGHAHICVCDYACVYQFQELHAKLLVGMNLFKCLSTNETQGQAFAEAEEHWGSYCRLHNLDYPSGIPKAKKMPAAAAEAAAAAAEDAPVAAEPIPAAAPAKKRPAAARVKKRPAAAPAAAPAVAPAVAPVPAPVAAAAAAADADDRNDYGIMLYKNNSIGIRAKFGEKNQVLSFGGTHCGKSSERLRAIAAEIVRDLQLGQSIPVCRAKGNLLAFA